MTIRDWPVDEQPRQKLLRFGADRLADSELLAIVLGRGVRGIDAVGLARSLLLDFGGLRQLLSADVEPLLRCHGLGPAGSARLLASAEVGRRCLSQRLQRGDPLSSPDAVKKFLGLNLRDRQREVFVCLFLDVRHRVLACEELFSGTVDGASVHVREVVKRALVLNAVALIVAHNHPSGVAEPSVADRSLTRRLIVALDLVEVRLLDHFIIGEGETLSFSARGLL